MSDRLREAAQLVLDAMLHDGVPVDPEHPRRFAVDAMEAALAEPEPEPFCYHDGRDIVGKEHAHHSDVFPLYTAPPTRRPLTEKEILELLPDAQHGWTTAFYGKWVARAIERAHGITGGNDE